MNIILEGPDACGKTTLASKLKEKYQMNIISSNQYSRNDLGYHLDLLDYQDNTVFDRFQVGEMIYPQIYGRKGMLSDEDFIKITQRIIDNNDLFIIFITSDLNVLNKRLVERGELDYLNEIKQQNTLFSRYADVVNVWEYKNFKIVDVAKENCYEELNKWIDERFGKTTFNIAYRKVCKDLLNCQNHIKNNAHRGASNELVNYQFTVDDLENNILTLKTRDISYTYLAGESLWYWEGRNDVNFISKFGKMWSKLTDDGITNNSAYGYILKEKHGFNQIEKIIDLLKKDPQTRRAVLNINIPNENVITTKDEMCTICLNFQIRNNKLNCTGVMRSNDVIFGLTYDFTYFTEIQKYIARKLKIRVGSYTHFAMSMHYYDKDLPLIKKIANGSLETLDRRFDFDNLIKNKEILIDYVENEWESKEEFEKLLETHLIIKEGH